VHEAIDPIWVESLFPDPTEPEAEAVIQHLLSSHTTIEQLGPLAEEAGVKTLVLNHFNPGTKRQRRMEAKQGFSGEVVVGEDLLRLGVGRPRGRHHRHRR
jgi:ribonuclease BN (tRNA processing enzyme)